MATATTESFRLDSRRLREHMVHEYGEPCGLDGAEEGGLAASIVLRLLEAQDCAAIDAPENIELQSYALDDAVLICVREAKTSDPNAYRRQVSTYSVETKYLTDGSGAFTECCATVAECLRRANEIVPALRLLQAAERASEPAEHRLPEVTVYHGGDGVAVVEIDTHGMGAQLHANSGAPYLRVWVNEDCAINDGPPAPLPHSREALGQGDPDTGAAIGKLVINCGGARA